MADMNPLTGWLALDDGRHVNLSMVVWYRLAPEELTETDRAVRTAIRCVEMSLANGQLLELTAATDIAAFRRIITPRDRTLH